MREGPERKRKRETLTEVFGDMMRDDRSTPGPDRSRIAKNALQGGALAGLTVLGAHMATHEDTASPPNPLQYDTVRTKDRSMLERMAKEITAAPVDSFGKEFFATEELKCLTDNVYYEARGEAQKGRYAIIFATLSRVLDKRYPKSICGVVHQPWQFSWTANQKLRVQPQNPVIYAQVAAHIAALMKNRSIAEATVIAGMEAGLPHGAIFYKRAGFEGSKNVQRFFSKLVSVGIVGNHEFFTTKEDVPRYTATKLGRI